MIESRTQFIVADDIGDNEEAEESLSDTILMSSKRPKTGLLCLSFINVYFVRKRVYIYNSMIVDVSDYIYMVRVDSYFICDHMSHTVHQTQVLFVIYHWLQ